MPISINFLSHLLTRLDPELFTPLKKHWDKIGEIHCLNYNKSLYFRATPQGIEIENGVEAPHFKLSGTLSNLIKLFLSPPMSPVALFSKYHINFEGDMSFLKAIHESLLQRDFNWEGHMSKLMGPLPALAISQVINTTAKWGKQVLQARQRDVALFLQEEQKIIPSQYELMAFYEKVDLLREDMERLKKRIEYLKEQYHAAN